MADYAIDAVSYHFAAIASPQHIAIIIFCFRAAYFFLRRFDSAAAV